MPIKPELIEQAGSVQIVDYLASKNIKPVRNVVGVELTYLSPLRQEKSPSFFVNPRKNKFKDFGQEEHRGNVFTLVQLLEGCNFPQAVVKLLEFKGQPVSDYASLFFSATENSKPIKQLTNIVELQNPVLLKYVQERGIPSLMAKRFLLEVMTTGPDRHYFWLGFRNDSNGHALRNRSYKRCEGTQDFTTFDLPSRKTVAVFEGFFDFLSAMVHFGRQTPKIPTVILNSTSNRSKAIAYLKQFEEVNCFFDRDKSGIDCLRLLRDNDRLTINDCSSIYEGHKDFNEFLLSKP